MNESNLTPLENEALTRMLDPHAGTGPSIENFTNSIKILRRSKSAYGFYLEFNLGKTKEISEILNNAAPETALEIAAKHPNGIDIIFFILYIRKNDSFILECTSTTEWPENEGEIRSFESAPRISPRPR